jgi:site-specific DNA recombinase
VSPIRCATYARYSTDRQSPLSIEDQLRRCREHADRQGWTLLREHAYADEALSGSGADRPALNRLLEAAERKPRPFDAVLVDDTSRLSRNQGDIARIFERLNFLGVRIVAVSQGIDSQQEQADVLVTVHGLVDALYVKELAKKTHRGMEGRVLKGLHAGGRCYGYRNVRLPDGGTRLEIEEAEAAVVRRIFEMSAAGCSLKRITKLLNEEKVPPPRRRADRERMTWCPTAIHAMLRREMYAGRVVWNRKRYRKRPGTNKRVWQPRPQAEWRFIERPELRIVSNEVWNAVRQRIESLHALGVGGRRKGLLDRSATSPYLFSGLLKCALCGGNLVIVSGHAPGRHPKYGCSQHHYRGACANAVLVRRDFLEETLLSGLQEQVLRREVIEYAMGEFGRQVRAGLSQMHAARTEQKRRKEQLESQLARLIATAAEAGPSASLIQAIRDRETELRQLRDSLRVEQPNSIERALLRTREFVVDRLSDLRGLLLKDSTVARAELRAHVREIRMCPSYPVDAKPHYVAEGKWDLLGSLARMLPPPDGSIRLVAGARFELATFGL